MVLDAWRQDHLVAAVRNTVLQVVDIDASTPYHRVERALQL